MSQSYTDDEIRGLRQLAKRVTNPGALWIEKPRLHPLHRQRMFRAKATSSKGVESRFLIYQRQSIHDDASYSCGIIYLPRGGPRLTLARYNGSNHQHGNIRYQPHIHRATAAAIAAGKPAESAARATARFSTLEGALACLIEDYRLAGLRAEPDHPSLFHGDQS